MCSIRDIFPTKARRVNVILATHRQTLKRRAPGKHRGLPHSAEAAGNYSCYVLIYFKQLRSMYIYSCSRSLITARVARRAAMFSSLSVCLSVCLFPYLLVSDFTFFVVVHLSAASLFVVVCNITFCPVFCFACLIQYFLTFVSLFVPVCFLTWPKK